MSRIKIWPHSLGNAEYFVTCDDDIIKKAEKSSIKFKVKICSILEFLEEVRPPCMAKGISEVKEVGWSALVERLGASGATLFILEYEKAYGDYTEDRKRIFDKKE